MKTLILSSLVLIASLFSLSAEVTNNGTWTKKSQKAAGTWSIDTTDGKTVLTLTDLKTKNAPDLKLFLSPKSAAEVSAKNAVAGSVLISKLKSNKGTQTYTIPASVDLSKYKSILIHCEKYTKLWSASAL